MSTPAPSRPCLLLVDDTPANLQILVELLKGDHDLKVATSGADALRICAATPQLDLILLDVMMPEMDGFDVCRRLRADPATRGIPVIFLTAKTELDDVVRGFDIGGNDYVPKPFRPAELLARVRTQLTIRAQQREIEAKNTEMKEMLQIVCHDVANHFAVLDMSLELMALNPVQAFERHRARVAAAVRNGIGLTGLVRELRLAEEKGLRLRPVPLRAALDEAVLLLQGRIEAKQLAVTVEVPDVPVVAEGFALTNSVFGNLLSNAIKFSHRGGAIRVTGQTRDGAVRVTFRDQGVGMPPAVVACLFQVTKNHSRKGTAGEPGSGFGMPLMHKFITLFGGSIEVATKEAALDPADHGTEFTLTLKQA